MIFPEKYKINGQHSVTKGEYSLTPIRYEDRYEIMQWRNEQLYHLRQKEPLTKQSQDFYFQKTVSKLFLEENPDQLLFSFFENNVLVGYGGLVHINWTNSNAEISFVMNTQREKEDFELLWSNYLELLELIAFDEIKLHKIYTYAFDVRPILYPVFEKKGFEKEAVLKEHCYFEGGFIDVIIHSKLRCNP
jgi:RimJ/RimL family protein N-acetyltransferase